MRAEIRAVIEGILPSDAQEAADRASSLDWVDSGAPLCRIRKPDVPPKHLIVYAVLIDGDYVLLVDHINAGLWLPCGGHVDPGEHPRDAMLREAREELGIAAHPESGSPSFLSISVTVGKTAGHTDVALWYAVEGDRRQALRFDGSEFHRVRWFPRDAVPLHKCDPHMGRFIAKYFDAPR